MQVENLGQLSTPFGQALRAVALTCAHFGRDQRKPKQVFHRWPPKTSQRKFSDVL